MSYVPKKCRTVAEVCNHLFKTSYTSPIRNNCTPSVLKPTPYNDYKVWFPKMMLNRRTGWENKFHNNNRNEIMAENHKGIVGKAIKDQINITFAYENGEYCYIGIFKLIHIGITANVRKEHWKRIPQQQEDAILTDIIALTPTIASAQKKALKQKKTSTRRTK
jgi:hypothetical protein